MSGIASRKGGECYLLDTGKVHSSEALYISERKIPLVPSLFLWDKTEPCQQMHLILNWVPLKIQIIIKWITPLHACIWRDIKITLAQFHLWFQYQRAHMLLIFKILRPSKPLDCDGSCCYYQWPFPYENSSAILLRSLQYCDISRTLKIAKLFFNNESVCTEGIINTSTTVLTKGNS